MLFTIGKVVICVVSAIIIGVVLLQKPEEAGAGSSFGGSTYLNATKGKTSKAKLNKVTIVLSVAFAVLSFALVLIEKYLA